MMEGPVITLAGNTTMKNLENIKGRQCVEKLRLITSQLRGGAHIENNRSEKTKMITLFIR